METVTIKHNEIESKFEVPGLLPLAYVEAVHRLFGDGVRSYRVCSGTDRYFTQGENVVRHRTDDESARVTLTCKKRLSAESIQNRKEIDLPISKTVTSEEAKAFLVLSGFEKSFQIEKLSRIFDVSVSTDRFYTGHVNVCIAMYDVWQLERYLTTERTHAGHYMMPPGTPQIRKVNERRFLEVEVDKSTPVGPLEAAEILEETIAGLRTHLVLGPALNQSLWEMYRPKK